MPTKRKGGKKAASPQSSHGQPRSRATASGSAQLQAQAVPQVQEEVQQTAFGLLPSELLAEIFSHLFASDVGRAASVCMAWRTAAAGEAAAWNLAMTELDPFCALGSSDMRLCFCEPESRGQADDKETSATPAGCTTRCSNHCSGSPACVPLKAPLYHRWSFKPFDEGSQAVVVGDDTEESARALQQAIDDAKPLATVPIQGDFKFSRASPLVIRSSCVRILGVGGASITSDRCTMAVDAELVMLEELKVDMSYSDPEMESDAEGGMGFNPERFETYPAIEVRRAALLERALWVDSLPFHSLA
jgi:hypothetical protein